MLDTVYTRESEDYLLNIYYLKIHFPSVHVLLHTYMDIFYRWKISVRFEEAVHKYDNRATITCGGN